MNCADGGTRFGFFRFHASTQEHEDIMSGIAGYLNPHGATPPASALSLARAALAHRGPDDSGLFEDRACGVGLVHTRLSILDLSPLERQLMLSDDGRVALALDGEIYNCRELRAELESPDHAVL